MNEEWNNIEKSVITNMIDSMKKRCLMVIESDGERIKY